MTDRLATLPSAHRSLATPVEQRAAARWSVLLAVGVGALMTALDSSVVNAVLPVITRTLRTDVASIQWVVTIYLLVLSGLMLTFGRLGDLHGHKRVYLLGFGVFIVGSAASGLAPSLEWLVISRAVQGVGAAMLMSTSPAILTNNFPATYRGRALGLFTTATYLGLAIGPSLGGWLADAVSWRAVFFINVPVGLLAFFLSLRLIQQGPVRRTGESFDVPGAVGFTVGLLLLLLALNQGHAWGWTSPATFVCLLAALGSLGLAFRYEWTTRSPMLDLRLFLDRVFSAAIGSAVLNYIGAYTIVFLTPFYLIQGEGLDPSQAGLVLMAMPVAMMLVAPISGSLSDRIGARAPSSIGLLLQAIGLAWLGRVSHGSPLTTVMAGLVVAGVGIGLFSSPNTSAALGTVPAERRGIASAVLGTARNLGMMLGVGLAGGIFTTMLARAAAPGSPEAIALAVQVGFLAAAAFTLLGAVISAVARPLRSAIDPHPPNPPLPVSGSGG